MPYVPKFIDIETLGYAEILGAQSRQLITGLEFRYTNGSNVNMEASFTNARMKVFRSVWNSDAIISVDSHTDQNANHGHPHGYSNSNVALVLHQSHVDIDIPQNKMDVTPGSYTFQLDFKRNVAGTYETAVVGTLKVLPSANGG